jgi:hypothetical protein
MLGVLAVNTVCIIMERSINANQVWLFLISHYIFLEVKAAA